MPTEIGWRSARGRNRAGPDSSAAPRTPGRARASQRSLSPPGRGALAAGPAPPPDPTLPSRLPLVVTRLLAVAALERQFGNAALVKTAQAQAHHPVELQLGRRRHRHLHARLAAQDPRDRAVLGRVGAGEVAFVGPVLHVLAVGFQ